MMTRGMKDVIVTKIHLTGIFNMPLTYFMLFVGRKKLKVLVVRCVTYKTKNNKMFLMFPVVANGWCEL